MSTLNLPSQFRTALLKGLAIHSLLLIICIIAFSFSTTLYWYGAYHMTMHVIGVARTLLNI